MNEILFSVLESTHVAAKRLISLLKNCELHFISSANFAGNLYTAIQKLSLPLKALFFI